MVMSAVFDENLCWLCQPGLLTEKWVANMNPLEKESQRVIKHYPLTKVLESNPFMEDLELQD